MSVLTVLCALRDLYQHLHWTSKSYSDHLRYMALYESVAKEIDPTAELLYAKIGFAESVSLRAESAAAEIRRVDANPIALEGRLAEVIDQTKKSRPGDSGLSNHLDGLLTESSHRIYKLTMA